MGFAKRRKIMTKGKINKKMTKKEPQKTKKEKKQDKRDKKKKGNTIFNE
jgi:hypothetical protein